MSGSGFHEKGDASGDFLEEFFGLLGDFLDSDFFALLHVGSHVADHKPDAEGGAPGEFPGESFAGHGGFFWFGGTQVDKVAVVADEGLGVEAGFLDGCLEICVGVLGEGFGMPLLRGRCEDLDCGAPDGFAPADCIGETFTGWHVGTDEGCGHYGSLHGTLILLSRDFGIRIRNFRAESFDQGWSSNCIL